MGWEKICSGICIENMTFIIKISNKSYFELWLSFIWASFN